MPSVKMKVKPPKNSLVRFSTSHPDDEFRFLASRQTEDGVHMAAEVDTSNTEALLQLLDETPAVFSSEVLRADQQRILLQFEVVEPVARRAARVAGILPSYPVVLRDGWITAETITSWEQLSQLKTEFE